MKNFWMTLKRVGRTTTNFFIITFKYAENRIVYDMTKRNEVPSYTQQEVLDAWNQYHALMTSEYKPTGAFGEVIE